MTKALVAAIMVAIIVCATAQAFAGNSIGLPGITSPICVGLNNVVTCHRQDMHGYNVSVSTKTVTVGRVAINMTTHKYVTKPILFSANQPTTGTTVTPKQPGGNLLYAGVYCEIDWHTNGIMCVPNNLVGYGIEIDTHHVVVLNVATGQMVFSKTVPQ